MKWGVSLSHSWLCHSYEAEIAEQVGIRPNTGGLLETCEEAQAVLAWMNAQPPQNAPEPVFWTVMAIAECKV